MNSIVFAPHWFLGICHRHKTKTLRTSLSQRLLPQRQTLAIELILHNAKNHELTLRTQTPKVVRHGMEPKLLTQWLELNSSKKTITFSSNFSEPALPRTCLSKTISKGGATWNGAKTPDPMVGIKLQQENHYFFIKFC